VPREKSADLERRLRAVEKKVRDAAEPSGPNPQAQARAEQFRERAELWRQWADAEADALTRIR
ncbi:MAG: hypothetical protein QOC88_2887, partial [Mycobacterium sp.]|nr:hypothetical protein [Mycobacterium sp.]